MDATGLALAVIMVLFLCWVLAPSRRRAEGEVEPQASPSASPAHDTSLVTGSRGRELARVSR